MLLRKGIAAVLVAVLLIGFAGLPAAQAAIHDIVGTRFEEAVTYLNGLDVVEGRPEGFFPMEPITRAEATKIIVEIIGQGELSVLLKGAPSFPDVRSDHWASGYIAVAHSEGILHGYPDGTFQPENPVTYAEYAKMLVEAAGLEPVLAYGWPLSYIDPAQKAGMLKDTDFSADAPAVRGDCAIMTATTVREVPDPATGRTLGQSVFGELVVATIELTPASQTTSAGAAVEFTAVARDVDGEIVADAPITITTSDPVRSMIIGAGSFVGFDPGTYTVTASVGDLTALATVNVYGKPVALRASASPSSIAANGTATSQITVEIVDSRGIRVPTATDRITIEHETDQGAVTLPAVTWADAHGGVATFTVTSTTLYDATDTLLATASGLTSDTVSVRTVEPKASRIRLVAEPTQLPANVETIGHVVAEVLDQNNEPMVFGTYYITFSITGKGLLEGGTDKITVGTSPVDAKATVQVSSKELDPGSFRITASASGLSSQSVTISTYIAGTPRSVKVTPVDTAGEAGMADDMKVIVGVVDSNGRPTIVGSGDSYTFHFETEDDAGLVGLADVYLGPYDSYATVDFHGTTAGKHTVTVREISGALPVSSTTFTCTVSAGELEGIAISPYGDPVIYIPLSTPKITLTAQLEDVNENPVAKSGVRVQFSAVVETGAGTVTWSASQGKVTTDSQGRATITMTGQGYSGNSYTVYVDADFDNDGEYDDAGGETATGGIKVTDRLPSDLSIAFTDPSTGDPVTYLQADSGNEANLTIQVLDGNDNEVEIDGLTVEVTFGNQGLHVQNVHSTYGLDDRGKGVYRVSTDVEGKAVLSFEGGVAGQFTVTAKCLNAIPNPARSRSFIITGGTDVVRALVLKTDNTPAIDVSFKAEKAVVLRVGLVDYGGNPIGAPAPCTIYLTASDGGEYRESASGSPVTEVELPKGAAYRTIYYINDHDGTEDLSGDATGYVLH